MSIGNAMDKMWANLQAIKQECWDLIGMNRQRYGSTFASDGKGNTEQAIFRSSILTAPMYFQFDKFMEMDYKGLLDASKIAYADGKKASYVNSDGKTAWFEIADEEVIDSARYALNYGMPGGGYIFSTSNCIYTGMDLRRYELMLDVWRKLG